MIFGKRYNATFLVKGMMCGKCASRVENALKEMPGVKKATADFEKGQVLVVSFKEIKAEEIEKVIVSLGYSFEGKAE